MELHEYTGLPGIAMPEAALRTKPEWRRADQTHDVLVNVPASMGGRRCPSLTRPGGAPIKLDLTATLSGKADRSAEAEDRGQVAEHAGGGGQGHGE
jgi:hypothetical protein